MHTIHQEKKRIKVTSGALPIHSSKLACLPACHPFSERLDIVFPTSDSDASFALLAVLEGLETSYGKARCNLLDIVEYAGEYLCPDGQCDLLVVSTNSTSSQSVFDGEEDFWCIDPRGRVTLSVSKGTYEQLGLVGQKLPFGKAGADIHVIDIPLQKKTQSVKVQARQKANLKTWDERRKNESRGSQGLWNVLCTSNGSQDFQDLASSSSFSSARFQDMKTILVHCKKTEMRDVHVPIPSLSAPPASSKKSESKSNDPYNVEEDVSLDDWNRHILSLFEWLGMACLGAQRLYLNDRVDPYVALYDPPEPTNSTSHRITHLQWHGLLPPKFVKKVLDIVLGHLQHNSPSGTTPFVGIACHAYTQSPVSYIPHTATPNGVVQLQNQNNVPKKLPRADGEDTWSLVVERQGGANGNATELRWCLAESIGRWDARWG